MDRPPSPPRGVAHPFRWFPEFLELFRRRFRSRGRVLAASVLVGVVAGLGAVVFSAACHLVVHYTLEGLAGYRAEGPAGEAVLPWLKPADQPLRLWLLLL